MAPKRAKEAGKDKRKPVDDDKTKKRGAKELDDPITAHPQLKSVVE